MTKNPFFYMNINELPEIKLNWNCAVYEPVAKGEIVMLNGDVHLGFAIGVLEKEILYMSSTILRSNGYYVVGNKFQQPIYIKDIYEYCLTPIERR